MYVHFRERNDDDLPPAEVWGKPLNIWVLSALRKTQNLVTRYKAQYGLGASHPHRPRTPGPDYIGFVSLNDVLAHVMWHDAEFSGVYLPEYDWDDNGGIVTPEMETIQAQALKVLLMANGDRPTATLTAPQDYPKAQAALQRAIQALESEQQP